MGVWILSVNNQDVALSSTDDSCSWLRPLWLWTDQFWSGLPVQVDKIYFLFVYCLTFVFFCGWTWTVSDWMSDVTFLSLALWSGWEWAEPVIWPRWNRFGSSAAPSNKMDSELFYQQSVCFVVWRNWTSDQTETTAEAQGWDLSVFLYLCYLNFWAKLKLPCG